jgi:hypothetical protein
MRLHNMKLLRRKEGKVWIPLLLGKEGLLLWEGAGKWGAFSIHRWQDTLGKVFGMTLDAAIGRARMHPHGVAVEVKLRAGDGLWSASSQYLETIIIGDEFLIPRNWKEKCIEPSGKHTENVRPATQRRRNRN